MVGLTPSVVHLRRRRERGRLVARLHGGRRRAKTHRNYDVAEAARLYGVHRNTVRNWIKKGLPVIGDGRAVLILGDELERFRKASRAASRRPCPPGTIYCLKCREPRAPIPASLGQTAVTGRTAVVTGLCSVCGTGLNRRTRIADLGLWTRPLDVTGGANTAPATDGQLGA